MGAMQVRHEPASAALVRRHMRTDLNRQGVGSESVDIALLVATELVGNAVRHTAPSRDGMLDIQWDLDGDTLTVQVCDSSEQMPKLGRPSVDQPFGRGLTIVDTVAQAWGARPVQHGKLVWATIALDRESARRRQLA